MNIVEKAAEKLRESSSGQGSARDIAIQHERPVRDHVAVAGQRLAEAETTRVADTQAAPRLRLAIDFAALRRSGLVAPIAAEDMVAREYQRIKRPLLANVNGVGTAGIVDVNCFMVASAIPGEGKTFSSFNLALSLAKERDYSVLLVDGDIIKPTISRALGVEDQPGLTDILADDSVLPRDVIFETNIPRLSFLPAGRRSKEATELLASQRMSWLMDEMSRDPNRILVFDSPPLLATAEAQALAMTVGQILVVVKAGSTNQNAVVSALSLVASPDKNVSLILNQSTKAHGDYYAGYYGGYYDGHESSV